MSDHEPDVPEFHIVVRRPHRRGPIAPYRLTLAVVFSLLVTGRELWVAATTGYGYDDALLHAGIAGLFIWVISGVVNGIMRSGRPPGHPSAASD